MAVSCEESEKGVALELKSGDKRYTEKAKYIINCEGVVGALKRKITGSTPQYITTFQTYNQGEIELDYHYFYAYLQPELSEYDAWFNVKDNQLVFGISVRNNSKIGYYYAQFISYMKEKHDLRIDKQLKTDKWLMPYIRPGCAVDYGVGRVFFAGEVAGFLNPMGEGISAGMESGYCVAKAITKHFDNIDLIYDEYRESTGALQYYMRRQWSLVGGMAKAFEEMKLGI